MSLNDIKHLAVETIYLVPDSSEGQRCYLWCDDPAPGLDMDPSEAVEYLRKDVHDAIIAKQANAAKQGMDAAKKVAGSNLEQAKRLSAESRPAALESEREANARLTELVAKLEQERDALAANIEKKFEYCPNCFHIDQREYVNGHCSICGTETQMGDKDLYIELIKKQNLEIKRAAEKIKAHLENSLGMLGIELPSEKPSLKLVHVNKDEK